MLWDMILTLWRIAASKIPGFGRGAIRIWRPIGSLKFRLAYRNACRMGNVYLHVGAGSVRLGGWLNTDIRLPCQLFLDATRRFPIRDNSVSYIFSEHFIEHVPRHAAFVFLKESLRVLRPSGILRIATPDVKALVKAYLNNPELVRLLNERNKWRGYQYVCYPIDILNKAFMEDGHLCLYDSETLQQLLISAGFENITHCKVGESPHTALSGIESHAVGSIADEFTCIIEATRPPL